MFRLRDRYRLYNYFVILAGLIAAGILTPLHDARPDDKRPPIRIAVIDLGLDLSDPRFEGVLCPDGHADFTGEGLKDFHGHGTHVAYLIRSNAGDGPSYCLMIEKYYAAGATSRQSVARIAAAIRYAVTHGARILNVSGGGPEFEEEEYLAIKQAEAAGVTIVAAAGNENANVDESRNYYFPASYGLSNIITVGSLNAAGVRSSTSNYGSNVKAWEVGEHVRSALPGGQWGELSGTSMACAIHTGKLIRNLLQRR